MSAPRPDPERFHIMVPIGPDLPSAMAADDFQSWISDMGDDKLTRESGRRVTDWRWERIVEDQPTFHARIGHLREQIGQPWDDDPEDLITAEDVARLYEAGPQVFMSGACWAERT